jgi:hypothetical protein
VNGGLRGRAFPRGNAARHSRLLSSVRCLRLRCGRYGTRLNYVSGKAACRSVVNIAVGEGLPTRNYSVLAIVPSGDANDRTDLAHVGGAVLALGLTLDQNKTEQYAGINLESEFDNHVHVTIGGAFGLTQPSQDAVLRLSRGYEFQ